MAGDDATDERKVQVVRKRRSSSWSTMCKGYGFRNQRNDAPSQWLGESARVTMFPKAFVSPGAGSARSERPWRVTEGVLTRVPPREMEQREVMRGKRKAVGRRSARFS